jgi:hypothetical protein
LQPICRALDDHHRWSCPSAATTAQAALTAQIAELVAELTG